MTGFKIKDWIARGKANVKTKASRFQIRSRSLTGAMQRIVSSLRNTRPPEIKWLSKNSAFRQRLGKYRYPIYGSLAIIGIMMVGSFGMQQYVNANTYEVYDVYVKGQLVGTVSSPQVVDDFKISKYKEIQENHPNVHMVLNTDQVVLKGEKGYKLKSDDQQVLDQLNRMLTGHAVGVELVVNNKVIGTVKDKDTAEKILNQVKAKFGGDEAAQQLKGKVGILSAKDDMGPGESQVQEVDFVQKVDMVQKDIDPSQIMEPDEIVKKLETGDVQPTKYTVKEGDCISCIAKDFNISKQVIYENNPWIVDDFIKIGQELDLTVLQPTLSVKTVEKVVEQQEIQYDTDYVKDDNLRAGVVETISPGKNGLKNVTFLVTKVNGMMMDEKMLDEDIVVEPVKAVAKKGTKVILGEGTGRFAWPVVNSTITSGFGRRWGRLHKGLDLVGNRSILAADNGKVIYTGYTSDYGNHIIITHMNGYKTLYGHLSKINVSEGQIVEKGEKIGVMGSTGDSTGVHLHFEIRKNDVVENPLKYLNR